jgi:hypothetical protein
MRAALSTYGARRVSQPRGDEQAPRLRKQPSPRPDADARSGLYASTLPRA